MARIKKDNFDLKLEVFYRREKQQALEAKADEVDDLKSEIKEMTGIIDQLYQELKERDEALDSAANLVLEREDDIATLKKQLPNVKSQQSSTISSHTLVLERRNSDQSYNICSESEFGDHHINKEINKKIFNTTL